MSKDNGPIAQAQESANNGEGKCDHIATPALGQKVSDDPISPAVSLAISPSTDENYTTESDGNQSSNQSGNKRSEKPNCYECKHRGSTDFSHHSKCEHPLVGGMTGGFLELFYQTNGLRGPAMKRMNISGNAYGIRNGWFMWPINFDPVWLNTCDRFEAKS